MERPSSHTGVRHPLNVAELEKMLAVDAEQFRYDRIRKETERRQRARASSYFEESPMATHSEQLTRGQSVFSFETRSTEDDPIKPESSNSKPTEETLPRERPLRSARARSMSNSFGGYKVAMETDSDDGMSISSRRSMPYYKPSPLPKSLKLEDSRSVVSSPDDAKLFTPPLVPSEMRFKSVRVYSQSPISSARLTIPKRHFSPEPERKTPKLVLGPKKQTEVIKLSDLKRLILSMPYSEFTLPPNFTSKYKKRLQDAEIMKRENSAPKDLRAAFASSEILVGNQVEFSLPPSFRHSRRRSRPSGRFEMKEPKSEFTLRSKAGSVGLEVSHATPETPKAEQMALHEKPATRSKSALRTRSSVLYEEPVTPPHSAAETKSAFSAERPATRSKSSLPTQSADLHEKPITLPNSTAETKPTVLLERPATRSKTIIDDQPTALYELKSSSASTPAVESAISPEKPFVLRTKSTVPRIKLPPLRKFAVPVRTGKRGRPRKYPLILPSAATEEVKPKLDFAKAKTEEEKEKTEKADGKEKVAEEHSQSLEQEEQSASTTPRRSLTVVTRRAAALSLESETPKETGNESIVTVKVTEDLTVDQKSAKEEVLCTNDAATDELVNTYIEPSKPRTSDTEQLLPEIEESESDDVEATVLSVLNEVIDKVCEEKSSDDEVGNFGLIMEPLRRPEERRVVPPLKIRLTRRHEMRDRKPTRPRDYSPSGRSSRHVVEQSTSVSKELNRSEEKNHDQQKRRSDRLRSTSVANEEASLPLTVARSSRSLKTRRSLDSFMPAASQAVETRNLRRSSFRSLSQSKDRPATKYVERPMPRRSATGRFLPKTEKTEVTSELDLPVVASPPRLDGSSSLIGEFRLPTYEERVQQYAQEVQSLIEDISMFAAGVEPCGSDEVVHLDDVLNKNVKGSEGEDTAVPEALPQDVKEEDSPESGHGQTVDQESVIAETKIEDVTMTSPTSVGIAEVPDSSPHSEQTTEVQATTRRPKRKASLPYTTLYPTLFPTRKKKSEDSSTSVAAKKPRLEPQPAKVDEGSQLPAEVDNKPDEEAGSVSQESVATESMEVSSVSDKGTEEIVSPKKRSPRKESTIKETSVDVPEKAAVDSAQSTSSEKADTEAAQTEQLPSPPVTRRRESSAGEKKSRRVSDVEKPAVVAHCRSDSTTGGHDLRPRSVVTDKGARWRYPTNFSYVSPRTSETLSVDTSEGVASGSDSKTLSSPRPRRSKAAGTPVTDATTEEPANEELAPATSTPAKLPKRSKKGGTAPAHTVEEAANEPSNSEVVAEEASAESARRKSSKRGDLGWARGPVAVKRRSRSQPYVPYFKRIAQRRKLNPLAIGLKCRSGDDSTGFYREILLQGAELRKSVSSDEPHVDVDGLPAITDDDELAAANPAGIVAEAIERISPRPTIAGEDGESEPATLDSLKESVAEEPPKKREMLDEVLRVIATQYTSEVSAQGVLGGASIQYNTMIQNSHRLRNKFLLFSKERRAIAYWCHRFLVERLPLPMLATYINMLRFCKSMGRYLVEMLLKEQQGEEILNKINRLIAEFIFVKVYDPQTVAISKTLTKRRVDSVCIVAVNPNVTHVDYHPKCKSQEYMYKILLPNVVDHVENVNLFLPVTSDFSVAEAVEYSIKLVSRKVNEMSKRFPSMRIVLAGWGTSCLINHQVVQSTPNVSAIINFAFPMKTVGGMRGDVDDDILLTYCPSLFVVGEHASDCDVRELQRMTTRMIAPAGVIVVGSANSNLLVSALRLTIERFTQRTVQRALLDDVVDFLEKYCSKSSSHEFRLKPIPLVETNDADLSLLRGTANSSLSRKYIPVRQRAEMAKSEHRKSSVRERSEGESFFKRPRDSSDLLLIEAPVEAASGPVNDVSNDQRDRNIPMETSSPSPLEPSRELPVTGSTDRRPSLPF